MNIQRKAIAMDIEGKDYEFVLDFESAIEFQDIYKKSIFVGIDKISKEQDLMAMACLIASCLKDIETGKCVGMDFVKKIDLIGGLEVFMSKITELMDNSLPTGDGATEKK